MTPLSGGAILLAGLAAGTINTIVGSGSLVTFPTLLAAGYAPITANVSNTLGLVPGSLSGAFGYRRELEGQRERVTRLALASIAGGVTGAILLLTLPSSVFEGVVPILILVACFLMAVQPRLSRRLATRQAAGPPHGGAGLFATVYLTGIYGGYFGAAQGVILISLLAIFLPDDLQRLNAAKNVLAGLVNGVAAAIFIFFAHVAWGAAAILAVGAVAGGQVGARVGRRMPPQVMRAVIVVVGVIVAVKLLAD
ncbi:MAG: sulfite exporter TauE/SafE family protein [Acidobacteria bacterium]|nr:sulfite exporter TauE/SafE family protein [Acidobacteriota bacterium]